MVRRTSGLLAAAVLVSFVAGSVTPASAAGLNKTKVRQLVAKVLRAESARLSVAHAKTADVATNADSARRATTAGTAARADDADRLAGAPPETYLDRIAFGAGPAGAARLDGYPKVIVDPVQLRVPAGIEFVRVTGVTSTIGPDATILMWVIQDATCAASMYVDPPTYGSSGPLWGNLTADRVLPVTAGQHEFTLCGAATAQSTVGYSSLVVETVASGATG